jgi:pimeloyl-ACP methyl ester carboxylesterase
MVQAIIIIGGYNSVWPAYLKMARDLEDLTGLQAVGVPLMPWDWWTAERGENATRILQKLHETLLWARRRFKADRFVLVGHSAGGIAARLYLCDQPVWGQVYPGSGKVATLITLGSPHCGHRGANTGWFLTDTANQLVPGTPHADRVRYIAVAGRYLRGRKDGARRERHAFRRYQFFDSDGHLWGDGVVPVGCAKLEGAQPLILDGIAHSRKVGSAWYGATKATIRRWLPEGVGHAH